MDTVSLPARTSSCSSTFFWPFLWPLANVRGGSAAWRLSRQSCTRASNQPPWPTLCASSWIHQVLVNLIQLMSSSSGIETVREPGGLVELPTVRVSTRMNLTRQPQVQMSCLCNREHSWNGCSGNSSCVWKVLFVTKKHNFESYDLLFYISP